MPQTKFDLAINYLIILSVILYKRLEFFRNSMKSLCLRKWRMFKIVSDAEKVLPQPRFQVIYMLFLAMFFYLISLAIMWRRCVRDYYLIGQPHVTFRQVWNFDLNNPLSFDK